MNSQEFLQILRETLQGELSREEVDNNIEYYDNYFREQKRNGKTEEEIISELGNPRLIAKTIIDTSHIDNRTYSYSNDSANYSQSTSGDYSDNNSYNESEQSYSGFNARYDENGNIDVRIGRFKLNSWYGKLIGILLLVLIVMLIIAVISGVAVLFFRYVLPIALIVIAVGIVIDIIKR